MPRRVGRTVEKQQRKWTKRLIKWAIAFAIGWLVEWLVGTLWLLVGLLSISLLAAVLRMGKTQRWMLDEFWGQIRGMVIWAMLPAFFPILWDRFQVWRGQPTTTNFFDLAWRVALVAVIVLLTYDFFKALPRKWR